MIFLANDMPVEVAGLDIVIYGTVVSKIINPNGTAPRMNFHNEYTPRTDEVLINLLIAYLIVCFCL